MGFRFQRRINILPRLRVNLSKSGVSTSVGRRGAWFTIGPRGTRSTVGLPGTGLSYSEQQRTGAPGDNVEQVAGSSRAGWLVLVVIAALIVGALLMVG